MNIDRKVAGPYVDWANLFLGVVLFLSPWLIGFTEPTRLAWNSWVCGLVVAGLAVAALVAFAEWEEWITALVGVWVAVSPWVLAGTVATAAHWTHGVVGLLIAALAAWRGWSSAHHGSAQAAA